MCFDLNPAIRIGVTLVWPSGGYHHFKNLFDDRGWVSDHMVVDHAMGTLHVFTGVELDSIPEARKRRLRAIAR